MNPDRNSDNINEFIKNNIKFLRGQVHYSPEFLRWCMENNLNPKTVVENYITTCQPQLKSYRVPDIKLETKLKPVKFRFISRKQMDSLKEAEAQKQKILRSGPIKRRYITEKVVGDVSSIYDASINGQFYLYSSELKSYIWEKFSQDFRIFKEFKVVYTGSKTHNKGYTESHFVIYMGARKYGVRTTPLTERGEEPKDEDPQYLLVHYMDKITQRETLDYALKGVIVKNYDIDYYDVAGLSWRSINESYTDEAIEYFIKYDALSERANRAACRENNEFRQKAKNFLNLHGQIVAKKKEWDIEHNILKVAYKGFKATRSSSKEGTIYEFIIDKTDDTYKDYVKMSDEERKNKGGAMVKVPVSDEGRDINAEVYEFGDDAVQILIRNVEDYSRIAQSGLISERENIEHRYKKDAIEGMEYMLKGYSSNVVSNPYLLGLLSASRTEPYVETVPYYLTNEERNKKRINESQEEAIRKALNTKDFLLVQGPPGTGKTTIIVEMLANFIKEGKTVLICSQNNLAVDNVIEKCQSMTVEVEAAPGEEKRKIPVDTLRLGRENKVIASVHPSLKNNLVARVQKDIVKQSEAKLKELFTADEKDMESFSSVKDMVYRALVFENFYTDFEKLSDVLNKKKRNIFAGKNISEFRETARKGCENAGYMKKHLKGNLIKFRVESLPMYDYIKHTEDICAAVEEIQKLGDNTTFAMWMCLGFKKSSLKILLKRMVTEMPELKRALEKVKCYSGNKLLSVCPLNSETPEEINVIMGLLTKRKADSYIAHLENQIEFLKEKNNVLKKISADWHRELDGTKDELIKPLLDHVQVVGATCIGVNTDQDFNEKRYDVAIVDEAGQIPLHNLMVPLVKANKIILIGDHMQLPPIGESDFVNNFDMNSIDLTGNENFTKDRLADMFNQSLFEKLFRDKSLDKNKVMLNKQFRMHRDISEFISRHFYENKYKYGFPDPNARNIDIAGYNKPIYFIDTCNLKNKREHNYNPGYDNACEADICADILVKIIDAVEKGQTGGIKLKDEQAGSYDIGVITAYKNQANTIRGKLRKALSAGYGKKQAEEMINGIPIKTLDSFQGRDNEIIFYSFVRSNKDGSIGFMNEMRRINVMMTRTKRLLIMVGDSETLLNTTKKAVHDNKPAKDYYSALIKYCKDSNGYINAAEVYSI